MSNWTIIDDKGREDRRQTNRVLSSLGGAMTFDQLVDYLVINCRHAALNMSGSRIHVRLRPELLAGAAFAELAFRLSDLPWNRAIASLHIDGEWQIQILPSDKNSAIETLSAVVAKHQVLPSETVLTAARALDQTGKMPGLTKILELWRTHSVGRLPSALAEVLALDMKGHFTWARARRRDATLILEDIGPGFPDRVRSLIAPGLGRRFEDQPDLAYGRYCALAYGAVAESGIPAFEDVDATMVAADSSPVRRRYSRLIVPFTAGGGQRLLLGVSVENSAVDLRRSLVV